MVAVGESALGVDVGIICWEALEQAAESRNMRTNTAINLDMILPLPDIAFIRSTIKLTACVQSAELLS